MFEYLASVSKEVHTPVTDDGVPEGSCTTKRRWYSYPRPVDTHLLCGEGGPSLTEGPSTTVRSIWVSLPVKDVPSDFLPAVIISLSTSLLPPSHGPVPGEGEGRVPVRHHTSVPSGRSKGWI